MKIEAKKNILAFIAGLALFTMCGVDAPDSMALTAAVKLGACGVLVACSRLYPSDEEKTASGDEPKAGGI